MYRVSVNIFTVVGHRQYPGTFTLFRVLPQHKGSILSQHMNMRKILINNIYLYMIKLSKYCLFYIVYKYLINIYVYNMYY